MKEIVTWGMMSCRVVSCLCRGLGTCSCGHNHQAGGHKGGPKHPGAPGDALVEANVAACVKVGGWLQHMGGAPRREGFLQIVEAGWEEEEEGCGRRAVLWSFILIR